MEHITPDVVDARQSTRVANILSYRQRRATQTLMGDRSRLLQRQAAPETGLDLLFHVETQFVVDIAIDA
jgi:hypothetical protein